MPRRRKVYTSLDEARRALNKQIEHMSRFGAGAARDAERLLGIRKTRKGYTISRRPF